jgi:iron complex outermembrane receptor protein
MELNKHDGRTKRLNMAIRGSFEIFEGLKVDAFYSLQSKSENWSQYFDKNSYWTGMDRNGIAHKWMEDGNSELFETTVNYTGNVGPATLTVLGGYSFQDGFVEGYEARGGDFINDAFTYNNLAAALDFANGIGEINSWKRSSRLVAFFGRVNVNVSDSWFLMASARYEGSTRFGADHQWGLFPAVGGGVDLANFINVASMDNLKLRVSYGITGQLPPDPYLSLLRLGPQGNFYYNGEFVPGYAPVSNANEDLAWERKGELNVGLDFSFFDGTLFGALDFYTRTTTNLLFTYDVPVPPNLYREAWMNLGEIQTSGIELALTWSAVQTGDFSYSVTLTPTYYLQNKLVSLSGEFNGAELEYGVRTLGGMGAPGQSDVPLVKAEEGGPIGDLYTHTFVEYDADGNLILQDTNEDGTVDPADRVVTGNGLPDAEFGWANNFRYKSFDANVTFRSVLGHDLINTYRGFYEVPRMIGSYNLPATALDQRNENGTLYNASSGVLNSSHVENASFLSIDNVTIGYNFDMSGSSAFRSIRVYLAGNNLLYITGYKGTDPNVRFADGDNTLIPGIDRRNTWFPVRSISLGVSLGL